MIALTLSVIIAANSLCSRIISLSPNITEILYALNLGDNVVGVSRYCNYPVEVKKKTDVGGYLDPSFERILALHASSVFLVKEYRARESDFDRMGLHTEYFDGDSVAGILSSIEAIGELCDVKEKASALASELRAEIEGARAKTSQTKKTKALVVIGSDSVGSLRNLYVSGNDGFYNELLSIAGGQNVMTSTTKSAAAVSLEGIVRMNPDVIIEIHPEGKDKNTLRAQALNAWAALPTVSAVQKSQIFVFTEDYAYIPGPRFPKLLNEFVSILHPQAQ